MGRRGEGDEEALDQPVIAPFAVFVSACDCVVTTASIADSQLVRLCTRYVLSAM